MTTRKRWSQLGFVGALLLVWLLVPLLPGCGFYGSDCRESADCGAGKTCVLGLCQDDQLPKRLQVCQLDGTCPAGLTCVEGFCTKPDNPRTCEDDTACRDGSVCWRGRCVPALCKPTAQNVSLSHHVQPAVSHWAASPDGRFVAWVQQTELVPLSSQPIRYELRLAESDTGTLRQVLFLDQEPVLGFAFLPNTDGDMPVLLLREKGLERWSLDTGTSTPLSWSQTNTTWTQLALSDDGRFVALASASEVKVWQQQDKTNAKEVSVLNRKGEGTTPLQMRFGGAKSQLLVHDGATLHLWVEGDSWKSISLEGSPRAVTLAPDADHAAVLLSGSFQLWQASVEKKQWEQSVTGVSEGDKVQAPAFSADSKQVATATDQLTVWSVIDGTKVASSRRTLKTPGLGLFLTTHPKEGAGLLDMSATQSEYWAFSQSGAKPVLADHEVSTKALFVPSAGRMLLAGKTSILTRTLTDAEGSTTNDVVWDRPPGVFFLGLSAVEIAFSKQTGTLISASMDAVLRRWKWEADGRITQAEHTFVKEWSVLPGGMSLSFLKVSPDARWVAVHAYDQVAKSGWLKLWDVQKATWAATLYEGAEAILPGLFFREDSAVVVAVQGKKVLIWETDTGKEVFSKDVSMGKERSIQAVAIDPRGELLAVAFEQQVANIELWPIKGSEPLALAPQEPFVSGFRKMAFSPDGRWLAMITRGGLAHVFDTTTRKQIYRFKFDGVLDVAFRADSEVVICIGEGRAIAWKLSSGQLLMTLDNNSTETPQSIHYRPDGEALVIGTQKGLIRLWSCPPE